MACPFCPGKIEKDRVVETRTFVTVLLSNPRLMPGHLLVVPKRHVEKLSELPEEERKELFETTIIYQEKILHAIAAGCDIRQHYRPFQKQDHLKVDHLHMHLQPRELFDELYEQCQVHATNVFKALSDKEAKRMLQVLRSP